MKHVRIAAPFFALCLFGLAGCSIGSKSSPSKFYVLSAMPENSPAVEFQGEPPNVGLARIEIPSYLDRPQMVAAVSKNELRYSEFNRWGDPLKQDIGEKLRQNLISLIGPNKVSAFPWMQSFPRDYNVQVIFQNFEAHSYNNEVVLRAVFRIEKLGDDGRETVFIDEVEYTLPVEGDNLDYDAVVEAQSKTLIRLSRAIAEALQAAEAGKTTATSSDDTASESAEDVQRKVIPRRKIIAPSATDSE